MRRFPPAALAALVLAASASADNVVVPLTVRPGSLALAPSTALPRSAHVSVTVTDARGRGAGWTLLARIAGPTRMLVVTGVDVSCGAHSTCTLPQNRLRYPILLSSLRAVPVLDAERGTGMGTIAVTLRFGSRPLAGVASLKFSVRPT
jgi:hypothetical protein